MQKKRTKKSNKKKKLIKFTLSVFSPPGTDDDQNDSDCRCVCVLPVGGGDIGSLCGQDGAAPDVQAELFGRQVHLHSCFTLIKFNQLQHQKRGWQIDTIEWKTLLFQSADQLNHKNQTLDLMTLDLLELQEDDFTGWFYSFNRLWFTLPMSCDRWTTLEIRHGNNRWPCGLQ